LPLALIVGCLMWSFLGGPRITDEAQAAATVQVTGSVNAALFIDTTACGASSLVIGDLLAGTDGWKTAQDTGGQVCTLSFGTSNHAPGADLSILEDPAAPASPGSALKCVSGCAGAAINDYDAGSEPAAGTSAFGVQLLGAGGGAAATWSGAPAVHGVANAGSTACRTSAPGTGSCALTFGATAAATDMSGSYQAQVEALVLAR
jgi:hypothetical protein